MIGRARRLLCALPLLGGLDNRWANGRLLGCCRPNQQQHQLLSTKWWTPDQHSLAMLVAEEPTSAVAWDYGGQQRPAWQEGLIVRPTSEVEEADDQHHRLGEVREWREAEALAALNAARRSRADGNVRKARSIIEHAYSLAPYNADILTEYGVFCEMVQRDVVEAEGFYLKALTRDPAHKEALIRRQRALPLVEEIDNRMMREIHTKRDQFMRIPRTDPGLRRAMRESYFLHVYHTVALEGNTISLVQTRSILETKMAVAGKSVVEHNEILGLDAALRWLNQSLSEVRDITMEHILALHKRVLGYADPLTAGQLRTVQVFVGSFRPPDANLVPSEMAHLVEWLNDEDTLGLDPVKAAALAHYKLVFIHPFTDGNGRTGRLLMNWILLRAGFPPVIIPVERRHRYYQVLREANDGDLRPFIRFIAELAERTLDGFISSAVTASSSTVGDGSSSGGGMCEIGGECPGQQEQQQRWEAEQRPPPPPFCTP